MNDGTAELVNRCAAGDRVALEALYRRYADGVWRYGWWRTGSREAAAEIVQETFLRLTRSIARFRWDSSFETWLFAVTRSAASAYVRQNGRDRRSAERCDSEPMSTNRPVDALQDDETRQAVRDALTDLPAAQRDAIVLCELCGKSIREAAELLDWGESRVKVTLFRARRRLRDRLSGQAAP